mgnify:CR=1 FL=1
MDEVLVLQDLGVDRELAESRFADIIPDCRLVWSPDPRGCPANLGSLQYLVTVDAPVPGKVMRESNLAMISVSYTGYDHIDLDAARESGIAVANVPGYATSSVAEMALLLTLGLMRRLRQSDYLVREVRWEEAPLGSELCGKTVGIVGTGRCGIATARLFSAFGCRILGYSRTEREAFTNMGGSYMKLDALLAASDVVSLHLPLNAQTGKFIDYSQLGTMKETSFLINTARGGLVNQTALARALENGVIGGAGLDVFASEPPPIGQRILYAPNTIFTPHSGCRTSEALRRKLDTTFENIRAFREGRILNRVDL